MSNPMMNPSPANPASTASAVENEQRQNMNITPELIEAVTDKVYDMLMKEMNIKHERIRTPRGCRYGGC
jgi:hypothetical protein